MEHENLEVLPFLKAGIIILGFLTLDLGKEATVVSLVGAAWLISGHLRCDLLMGFKSIRLIWRVYQVS